MKRRSFLKSTVILSVGFPYLNAGRLLPVECIESDHLYTLFVNPPVTSKPFVRWWWNGLRLSEKEILRQLDVMNDAGIGGVEINSIAFPNEAEAMGIPSMEWLSPEWIDMIKIALKGAEERGMICDIIVGSGWPFGGEFLDEEERSQLLTLTSRQVQGGKLQWSIKDIMDAASPKLYSNYNNPSKELYSLCLAPLFMDTFTPAMDIPFDKNAEVLELDIPEGDYILYAMVKMSGFQAVINGAPGAAGPVLNHYNKDAVNKFLNRMSDKLFPAIQGLKGFRSMFCDSMELEGANWYTGFPAEFKKRRGYDIIPYLPFILYKVGHMGHAIEDSEKTVITGPLREEIERIRYDFYVVCMEIIHDNFLTTYNEWCHRHGVKSRMQPYGREFHPLEASMHLDIPECETWLWNSDSMKEVDFSNRPASTNANKYVASAAHYTGKRLVSCEEITNTGMVFNATLERVKVAGDQSNLSGVTHSILHGYNYSPEEAEFPGWIRFGAYFSERNTWWPYFKNWSAYKARLSTVLQNTDFFADIAIMQPLGDLWTKFGPQRDPFPAVVSPAYQFKVWEAVHQSGCSCDYISESIIQQSNSRDGYIQYNTRKYHTLILLRVESLMPETMKALAGFVKEGGKIIFVESSPKRSVGFVDYKEKDKEVARIMEEMKSRYAGQLHFVDAPGNEVLDWFMNVQEKCGIIPYLKIAEPNKFVSQIRHQDKDKDFYFFSNSSTDIRYSMRVVFPQTDKKAWLWNPETGERYKLKTSANQEIVIDLPPAASKLIVYDTYDGGTLYPVLPVEQASPIALHDWSLELQHMTGSNKTVGKTPLKDLSTDPETQAFAGTLIYTGKFPKKAGYNYIDLGKVYGVSEVTVNGNPLGSKWYGRHIYQIPAGLQKAKEYTIQVKVITITGNYMKSATDNKAAQAQTHRQDLQPMGLLGPVVLV